MPFFDGHAVDIIQRPRQLIACVNYPFQGQLVRFNSRTQSCFSKYFPSCSFFSLKCKKIMTAGKQILVFTWTRCIYKLSFFFSLFIFCHATQLAGSQFPDQGWNPDPWSSKLEVQTTGSPGNSQQASLPEQESALQSVSLLSLGMFFNCNKVNKLRVWLLCVNMEVQGFFKKHIYMDPQK